MNLRVLNESEGVVGEIVSEGTNVTLGYWRAPQESKGIFLNGALNMSDLARIDKNGCIHIVDRGRIS